MSNVEKKSEKKVKELYMYEISPLNERQVEIIPHVHVFTDPPKALEFPSHPIPYKTETDRVPIIRDLKFKKKT